MEITEIRIKLMDDPNDRLQAFCSITFDYCFVIRDLKIIQGLKGSFVAMPSRKLTDRCPRCSAKNHLRAQFCSECGVRLQEDRAIKNNDGRAKLYADIAHPINSDCRDMIQRQVIEAFHQELERSKMPGYICSYDDYGEDAYATLGEDSEEMLELRTIVSISEGARRNGGFTNGSSDGYRQPQQIAVGQTTVMRHGHQPSRMTVIQRCDTDAAEGFGDGLM